MESGGSGYDESRAAQGNMRKTESPVCGKKQRLRDSFGDSFEEYGLIMPAVRLDDKLHRFKQLIKQETEVKDESITDTLMDLANYAIMTIIEIENKA